MSFSEQVRQGDAVAALRTATVYGALWAIGSSWSTAVRKIVLQIVVHVSLPEVWGELLAVGITTILGIGVALVAVQPCRRLPTTLVPPPLPTRPVHPARPTRSRPSQA